MINSISLYRKREIRKNLKPLPPHNNKPDEINKSRKKSSDKKTSTSSKMLNISNSIRKSISKTKSESIKINHFPASLKKNKMVFKKLPVKIEDIKNILNIPFKKIDYNNNFIKSLLFKKYTSDYDKNIELLRIDIENGRDGEYKEYYKYLDKIRTHLDDYDIFKIVNEIEDDNSVAFYNELKSLLLSYDPLNINDNQLIKLKNLLFSEKCIKLYNSIIIYEFRNAIIHNNTGGKVTKNTLKNKLKERVINYYTIQFISNIINNLYLNILNGNIIEKMDLINILANEHNYILINNPRKDTAFDNSNLQNSSSLDSNTYIKIKRNKEKEQFLAYLKNNRGYINEINDADFITHNNWEDMPLSKLRRVIKISHTDNKKNFCYVFDSKELYKLWKYNYYSDREFKNPYSQKEFTEEEMNTILITLGKRDFRYDEDDYITAINTRHDIDFMISIIKKDGIIYGEIKILYSLVKGLIKYKGNSDSLRLIRITISSEMPDIDNLLKKISSLYESNKIISKMIPFRFHPAFVKYNFATIDKDEPYNEFYNMIFTKY